MDVNSEWSDYLNALFLSFVSEREHAFYLQHQNRKPDYLNNIWKVINFAEAEARLQSSIQS